MFGEIEQNVPFSDIEPLAEIARNDDTTPDGFMPPKDRDGAVWFLTEGVACSAIFFPGNRSATIRTCHAYCRPERRGEGHGKAHLIYRYEYAKKHPDCERVDALSAYGPSLHLELGFEIVDWRGEDNSIAYVEKVFD